MAEVRVKPGVSLFGTQPEMLWATDRLAEVWIGPFLVITSGRGDSHSIKSRHYSGLALDYRSRDLTNKQIHETVKVGKKALGEDYDFFFENDHFHCEYDPENKTEYPR